ncbi:Uncharacterized protein APZ42_004444 [Daphnia magna]|uniref:Uncharacterized protein n=1 Tax=Daphnia magna TaxID=35525 RepID=A0A164H232_9CRUS|nr:Uncharacterized protein APZ42_004444 [Daphnia magna]
MSSYCFSICTVYTLNVYSLSRKTNKQQQKRKKEKNIKTKFVLCNFSPPLTLISLSLCIHNTKP